MLVLSRKENESILIGSSIEIKIAGIHGNQIRIGITAPRRISVWRKELVLPEVAVQKRAILQNL